jgi:hypothetical protein
LNNTLNWARRPVTAGAAPLHDFPYSVIYTHGAFGLRILVVRHQHRDPAHGESRR